MAAPQGVCVAFADGALAANPTWTALAGVTGWTIDRGRSFELDRTQTGTAQVTLIDTLGTYDPTNPANPLAIEPMKQAAIALQNPVDSTWNTLFTGFVHGWSYTLDVSEKFFNVTLDLVDAFELFAALEMTPSKQGGTGQSGTGSSQALVSAGGVPLGSEGDIYYDGIGGGYNGTTDHIGPDDRIHLALNDAKWPVALRNIFSGNVALEEWIYARRDQLLSVIFDAADAEFPGVANVFMSRDGLVTFHGRYARFDPTNPQYNITFWPCGDLAAAANTAVAPISALEFNRDASHIVNSALVLPAGVPDTDVPAALVTDAASIASYGTRSISFENLLLYKGEEVGSRKTGLDEGKLYSNYWVDNYAQPRNRVSQIRLRTQSPTSPNAAALWGTICGIEISDIVTLTTTHPGGGGFKAEDFYVEGIHYDAVPMTATYPEITLALDLSPRAYYDKYPF